MSQSSLKDLYAQFTAFDESDLNKIHELLDEAFDKDKIEERLYDNLKHYTYAAVSLDRSAVDLAVGELIEASEAECRATGVDGLVENHRKLVEALAQLRKELEGEK